jgi:hypothetical protein
MKLLKASLATAVVGIAFLASCSKGSTGATGPAGPAGPDSVYHSDWANLAFTGGTDDYGDSLYGEAFSCAQLTQGIIDSGMVVSYIGFAGQGGGGDITDVYPTTSYPIFENYEVGSIFFYTPPTPNGYGLTLNGAADLRWVIIPGTVLTTTTAFKGMSKAQISTMSYEKLMTAAGNKATVVTN